LPIAGRRLRAAIVVTLAATVLIGLLPATSVAKEPPGLNRFLWALGRVESGGRYTARNVHTGAYGKYQIMPATWRGWARRYLGNSGARPTPRNQEIVARRKVTSLWSSLHDWRFVAHVWLTGHAERNTATWSAAARRYIARVMRMYRLAPAHLGPALGVGETSTVNAILADDRSASIHYAGGAWRTARHPSYVRNGVHYATTAGASATFTFAARKVTWYGPVGPTRGKARVFVDGRFVKTVNLDAAHFRARTVIFSTHWATAGSHTLRIEVVGTAGHPLVAIDAFSIVH
jgi:hypothetical protein